MKVIDGFIKITLPIEILGLNLLDLEVYVDPDKNHTCIDLSVDKEASFYLMMEDRADGEPIVNPRAYMDFMKYLHQVVVKRIVLALGRNPDIAEYGIRLNLIHRDQANGIGSAPFPDMPNVLLNINKTEEETKGNPYFNHYFQLEGIERIDIIPIIQL